MEISVFEEKSLFKMLKKEKDEILVKGYPFQSILKI